MATYGFTGMTIEETAQAIEQAAGVKLYQQNSPMIGPWYTDADLSALVQALRAGKPADASAAPESYQLILNDPEPGYMAPEFPGGYTSLLTFSGSPDERMSLEEKLRKAGLRFSVLTKKSPG
jgi:hypothetical protein